MNDDSPDRITQAFHQALYQSATEALNILQVLDVEGEPNTLVDLARKAISEIRRLRGEIQDAKDFHPRAAKLIAKRKNFLVVAEDEPYFRQVYDLIRDHEMEKGTWTQEDQWHYDDAIYPVKLTGSIQEKAAQVTDAMEDIVDQIARKLGFAGNDELVRMVAALDLSDPVTLTEYKVWQMEDGTKAGLLAAFPELAKPAS